MMAVKSSISVLQKLINKRVSGSGFESLFNHIKVVSGGDGDCCCEMRVTPKMVNQRGTIHGGVITALVDSVSSFALTTTGTGSPGMSVDLNVSFMKPAALDETILIKATTLRCGKTLAVGSVDIIQKDTGRLVAQGRHSMFVGKAADVVGDV